MKSELTTTVPQEVWYAEASKSSTGDSYVWAYTPGDLESLRLVGGPIRTEEAGLLVASRELLAFAKWAVDQFQGTSGAGENYWEQHPEYKAGQAAIAKAEAE